MFNMQNMMSPRANWGNFSLFLIVNCVLARVEFKEEKKEGKWEGNKRRELELEEDEEDEEDEEGGQEEGEGGERRRKEKGRFSIHILSVHM